MYLAVNAGAQINATLVGPIRMGNSYELKSSALGETRKLNVYLPETYREGDSQKYAVIYLLDGGIEEDFFHIAGLIQYATLPWVQDLPACILVGIENGDRKRDMTFATSIAADQQLLPTSGGSMQFIAFIKEEVQPFIQSLFPVTQKRYLIGQSLAGLLATEILLTQPMLFTHYIIISPSLWWDDGSMIQRKTTALAHQKLSVYLAVGREGLSPGKNPHVMETDAHLLEEKLKDGLSAESRLFLDYLPRENHATITHQAVYNAFRWMKNQ